MENGLIRCWLPECQPLAPKLKEVGIKFTFSAIEGRTVDMAKVSFPGGEFFEWQKSNVRFF